MLSLLTRTPRVKAAIFMVALYAFTVLAPHAAMAFGGAGAAHCLTEQDASVGHAHAQSLSAQADEASHADRADSKQPDNSDEKGPAAACCGLFSASAMLSESREILPSPVTAVSIQVPLSDLVEGQGPDRINRPPIT